ncbi:hypothetical protein G7054_g13427 [Neopestalotiopsis clavispora]|nr:hypothetical protein G7054_g13427 [Neopestalotiopsis clavispora]
MAERAIKQYEHDYFLEGSEESSRLSNQHEIIKDAMGRLVLAPINLSVAPLNILDSGTADGTWIRDLAASTAPVRHEFYGTDINPAEFPTEMPDGTTYRAQDINQPWPEDWKELFDLVHQRLVLVGSGSKQNEALQSLAGLVKPGGWIQLIEATNCHPAAGCGPKMHVFIDLTISVFQAMGADLKVGENLPLWLEKAGFTDIEHLDLEMKMGAQNPDKELARRGVFSMSIATRGLTQFAKTFPPGKCSLSAEQLDSLPEELDEELKTIGGLYPVRVVWGRKAT